MQFPVISFKLKTVSAKINIDSPREMGYMAGYFYMCFNDNPVCILLIYSMPK